MFHFFEFTYFKRNFELQDTDFFLKAKNWKGHVDNAKCSWNLHKVIN